MMNKSNYILLLFVALGISSFAQKKNKFALINATAHIGNGTVIDKAIIVTNNDKIEMCMSVVGFKPDSDPMIQLLIWKESIFILH